MFGWFCIVVCASVGRFLTAGLVMVGQPRAVPVNSTGVLTAARFAVVEFNKANPDDPFAYKIVNITSAEIQVVSGINYILEMVLGRTMCKGNDTAQSEPCVFNSEPKRTAKRNDAREQRMKEDIQQRSQCLLGSKAEGWRVVT